MCPKWTQLPLSFKIMYFFLLWTETRPGGRAAWISLNGFDVAHFLQLFYFVHNINNINFSSKNNWVIFNIILSYFKSSMV
jgi:hypothetical protein